MGGMWGTTFQNGLFFDTRSFNDFCGKVRALVGDGELRAMLQVNAGETIRKNRAYEEFIGRFEEVAGGEGAFTCALFFCVMIYNYRYRIM